MPSMIGRARRRARAPAHTVCDDGRGLFLDGVREALFYPAREAIGARCGDRGRHISARTTGDVLTPDHIEDMLSPGVRTIAVTSMDDFHVGLERDKTFDLMENFRATSAMSARTHLIHAVRDAR